MIVFGEQLGRGGQARTKICVKHRKTPKGVLICGKKQPSLDHREEQLLQKSVV